MILNYLLALLIVLVSIFMLYSTVKNRQTNFLAGICCGFAYFIGGPVTQLLLFGEIPAFDLPLPPVKIGESSLMLPLLAVFSGIFFTIFRLQFRLAKNKSDEIDGRGANRGAIITTALIYLVLAVAVFIMSGKSSGGHWMDNYSNLYAQSAWGVMAGNFYNVMRVAVPGLLLFCFNQGRLSTKSYLLFLTIFTAIELYISSNRIIVLLCLFSFMFAFYKTNKRAIIIMVALSPLILQLNYIFPVMRGLLWSEGGADVAQIAKSYETARKTRSDEGVALNAIITSTFESSNLVVLKYVIDTFPDRNEFFLGKTVYIKSITFLLPKAIWPNKPSGFGTFLGKQISGSDILTLNSTLIGEAYGNFGFFSMILLPINVLLASMLFRFLKTTCLKHGPFFIAFAAWRFDYSFLVISSFALFLIYIIITKRPASASTLRQRDVERANFARGSATND